MAVSRDFFGLCAALARPCRAGAFLSAGAADLMYLAVRLAIVDLTLPGDEPCPIVLDDALVNLDSARRAAAMEVLGEIAETRQVILFTCS
ncbi:MAG: ATP-binding protein [Oscillospiraceae bacterium]